MPYSGKYLRRKNISFSFFLFLYCSLLKYNFLIPFFPGFKFPSLSKYISLMSTYNFPLKSLTVTCRLFPKSQTASSLSVDSFFDFFDVFSTVSSISLFCFFFDFASLQSKIICYALLFVFPLNESNN